MTMMLTTHERDEHDNCHPWCLKCAGIHVVLLSRLHEADVSSMPVELGYTHLSLPMDWEVGESGRLMCDDQKGV